MHCFYISEEKKNKKVEIAFTSGVAAFRRRQVYQGFFFLLNPACEQRAF